MSVLKLTYMNHVPSLSRKVRGEQFHRALSRDESSNHSHHPCKLQPCTLNLLLPNLLSKILTCH